MTLKETRDRLSAAGIENADTEARELFYAFGGAKRAFPLSDGFESCSEELEAAVCRRVSREPLQYIIGEVFFYRESYKVTPDCLIPRPDTEILVEAAERLLPRNARIADLCCGSGCIGISTAKGARVNSCVLADISERALAIARENAERNGAADVCRFVCADVTAEESARLITGGESFDAILSNPPYVSESAYEGLEPEIYREPKIAFLGGKDGGDFYRTLTPLYLPYIKDGGFLAYEIGYDQAELLREIANSCGCTAEIIKDYSGNDRVAILKKA